jgi:tetratricopeptide (TPR) repeat protein
MYHVDTDNDLHHTALPTRIASVVQLLESGDNTAAEQAALALCQEYPRAAIGFTMLARCAADRGDAKLALDRWRVCQSRFPDQAEKWQLGLAYAYLGADRLQEAASSFEAVLARQPNHLPALAGQATVVSRTLPAEAEPLWLRLFDLAGGPPKATWQISRARALHDCGRTEQAIEVLEETLRDTPGHALATAMLAKLRGAEHGTATVIDLLKDEPPANSFRSHLERHQQQRMSLDLRGARKSLMAALECARHEDSLTFVLRALPSLFQGEERAEVWRALRARAAAVLPPEAAATVCLQLRLDIALRDFDSFLRRWDTSPEQPAPWQWRFERVAATLRAPAFPDFSAPKVFGIGLSKTGTSSLGAALDKLGYLQAHFDNPFSHAMLSDLDFLLFEAASDSPVSARFETLYAQFPNAKFIITERPMGPWLASFNGHFERWYGSADFPFRERSYDSLKDSVWGLDLRLAHGALYPAHANPVDAYHAHTQRVERFFADKPPGKLLRHNIFTGDGWPELCAFLGHAVPPEPYPWSNQAPLP